MLTSTQTLFQELSIATRTELLVLSTAVHAFNLTLTSATRTIPLAL